MTRMSVLAALGAIALLSAQPASASAVSEAASSWTDQFSEARGAVVHVPTVQRSSALEDGAEDYVNSLRNNFRAEKRLDGSASNYDAAQSYIDSFN